MKRSAASEQESVGNDSFLDVISNFVGILIILVMVVGERASRFPLNLPPPGPDLTATRAEAASLEQDVHRIAAQMATVQGELAARDAERNQVSTLVTAIDQELAARRAALDGAARRKYDLERDLALARDEMQRLDEQLEQTKKSGSLEMVKIENYPTPISKTVDSKEIHFQLIGGKLTFVPFEALIDKLKGAVRDQARRMEDQAELTDTLGPIGGFRMRYGIERFDTPHGSFLQVAHVELIPVSSDLGETLEMAFAPKSTLRSKLEMISPRQYTITVWTYPDSFAEFRQLKKELYKMGYAVAGRPLPEGMPIGASPNGSKSSSE